MPNHKTHVTNLSSARSRKPADAILADLLQEIFKGNPGPVLIAVGGPGGTGKSTFSQALAEKLHDATTIRLDDYKTPRQSRQHKNLFGAHPDANRMGLIRDHLAALKQNESIEKPVYDSHTGEANETRRVQPGRFVILDGEISTYSEFREFVDLAVFIDSDWTTQLNTRICRDISVRGYSREKAIATFLQSNLREFTKFGAESKRWADIHLYSHDDYHLEIESISQELLKHFHDLLDKHIATVDLTGLIVAVTTPFDDNRMIDRRAFITHLEFLAQNNVKRILVNGTTGEFFSLLPEERKMLLTLARRYFPGVVLSQVGSDSLAQTLKAIKWAEKYGADAVVALPPYYPGNISKPGLQQYFERLATATDLPLLLYNFPKHTRNPLDPELLREIPHYGLKDSAANLNLMSATPHYFIGNDKMIVENYRRGGCGFVSGLANAFPEPYVSIERACRENNMDTAKKLQAEICEMFKPYADILIPGVKAAVAQQIPGYPTNVRLPLTTSKL
ncbi:MAG: dihydrodipicolinate synthase family protein [Lentisphaeria bacterium]